MAASLLAACRPHADATCRRRARPLRAHARGSQPAARACRYPKYA